MFKSWCITFQHNIIFVSVINTVIDVSSVFSNFQLGGSRPAPWEY